MTSTRIYVVVIIAALLASLAARAQAPSAQPEAPPTTAQLREAVSRLRGNRIATPNDYDTLTPAQKQYVASILSGPRSDISGPLGVMMVTPELGDLSQKALAYARFAGREGFSTVPPKLNELAILVVAKHWSAEYVWNAHHTAAVRFGLPAEVVEAIRAGKRPTAMEKDVEVIYDFATEFMGRRTLSDGSVNAAKTVLGSDRGVVDLVGTMGLYQISSMMVALDKTPLGQDRKPFFQ